MAHCGDCEMDFSNNSNLRAHLKRKHPEKVDVLAPKVIKCTTSDFASSSSVHKCTECNKTFASLGNLRFHIKKKHFDKLEELAPIESKIYKCATCKTEFKVLQQLHEHKRSHIVPVTFQCPLCQYTGTSTNMLIMHFKVEHYLLINIETLEFESFEAFQHWKSCMEKETFASFIQIRGITKNANYSKIDYKCHRSGEFKSRGKNIRQLKTQGSNKIGGYCPAKMSVIIKNDNKCEVQFCRDHVGHGQQEDLGHLFLTKNERENIAAKIAAKIPLQSILDEIRDSVSNCQLERFHLLTKKDLYNIESSFQLTGSSVRHQNDAVSVEAWVNELKLSNSVLYYKGQDKLCDQFPDLKSQDFVLIIMTEGQKELLLNFGEDCICVDGTHGLNGYGFELHTLLVLDDLREGYPCAFLISNRSDTEVLKIFFANVEEAIQKKVSPRVFMSDMAEAYYNAWLQVMHPAKFRLFCTWHVDKAWRKNLDKIKNNSEKKALIYQMLRMLLHERDICAFKSLLSKFNSFTMASPDTVEFGKYFQEHYASKAELWAYCFRLNSGLNTNMHIERMHRTIKHLYLNGKFVKRLDKAIGAIMKFVRDKLFERLIVLHKGKVSTKIKDLRHRHKTSEILDVSKVAVTSKTSWIIPSSSCREIYVIEEVQTDCNCKIICNECNSCIHRYSCTCMDSCIKWNMCKHIHLVCRYIQNLPKVNEDVEVQSESNLVIDTENSDLTEEVTALVKSVSTNKPSIQDNSQQQILHQHQEILQDFKETLFATKSSAEIDVFRNILAPLKPTLAAVRNTQTSNFVSVMPYAVPHNKCLEPQRRLFATKKSKKKKQSLRTPSADESDTLAIQLLRRDEEGV